MSFTPPANPSCLDESGQPVDYWVALKVPLGSNYFVYTSANDGSFALSPYNLSQSTQGCIMQTVQQIYNFNNETHPVDYGAYNDAPPPPIAAASSVYAHSKGIIMTNASTGFWLIHSVPEWPNTIAQGPAPLPDFTYGQSFMCVTVTASTMDLIAQQLMINRPKIYDRVRSQAFYNTLPNVDKLLKNQYTKDPNNSTTNWKSLNGKPFTQFAKSGPYCKRDLWDDFVAPYFHNAINVETWRNGAGGRISSICGANGMKNSPYDVMEVQSVKLGNWPYWNGTQDHSKWACANPNYPNGYQTTIQESNYAGGGSLTHSIGPLTNFSCVGDVNRMCSQETRGGGALCVVDDSIWHAFNTSIRSLESCYMTNPCTQTAYPTPAPSASIAPSGQCYWCSFTPYPSPAPTPTASPSIPLLNFTESYSASNTDSASISSPNSVASSAFYLCSDLTVSDCPSRGGSFTGQTYFRLIDQASGSQLAYGDDSACGGTGSQLMSYSPPNGCTAVYLSFGCAGSSACSAVFQVTYASGNNPAPLPTKAPTTASSAALDLHTTDGILAYIVAPIVAGIILFSLLWSYRNTIRGLFGKDYIKANDIGRNPSTSSALSFVEDSPALKDKGGNIAKPKAPSLAMRIPKSQSNPMLKNLSSESGFNTSEPSLDGDYDWKRVKSLDYSSSSPGML